MHGACGGNTSTFPIRRVRAPAAGPPGRSLRDDAPGGVPPSARLFSRKFCKRRPGRRLHEGTPIGFLPKRRCVACRTMADAKSITFRPAVPSDAQVVAAIVNGAYRGDATGRGWTSEA